MRQAVQVPCTCQPKNAYKILIIKFRGREHLGDQNVDRW